MTLKKWVHDPIWVMTNHFLRVLRETPGTGFPTLGSPSSVLLAKRTKNSALVFVECFLWEVDC